MAFPPGCLTAPLGATLSHPPPWRERGIAWASYSPGLGNPAPAWAARYRALPEPRWRERRTPRPPRPPTALGDAPRPGDTEPTAVLRAPGGHSTTAGGPGRQREYPRTAALSRPRYRQAGRERSCGGPEAGRSGRLPSLLHPSPSAPLLGKLLFNPAGLRAAAGPPGRPAGKTRSGRRGRRRRVEQPGSTWAEAGPSSRRPGPLPRRPRPRGGRWPSPAVWG